MKPRTLLLCIENNITAIADSFKNGEQYVQIYLSEMVRGDEGGAFYHSIFAGTSASGDGYVFVKVAGLGDRHVAALVYVIDINEKKLIKSGGICFNEDPEKETMNTTAMIQQAEEQAYFPRISFGRRWCPTKKLLDIDNTSPINLIGSKDGVNFYAICDDVKMKRYKNVQVMLAEYIAKDIGFINPKYAAMFSAINILTMYNDKEKAQLVQKLGNRPGILSTILFDNGTVPREDLLDMSHYLYTCIDDNGELDSAKTSADINTCTKKTAELELVMKRATTVTPRGLGSESISIPHSVVESFAISMDKTRAAWPILQNQGKVFAEEQSKDLFSSVVDVLNKKNELMELFHDGGNRASDEPTRRMKVAAKSTVDHIKKHAQSIIDIKAVVDNLHPGLKKLVRYGYSEFQRATSDSMAAEYANQLEAEREAAQQRQLDILAAENEEKRENFLRALDEKQKLQESLIRQKSSAESYKSQVEALEKKQALRAGSANSSSSSSSANRNAKRKRI